MMFSNDIVLVGENSEEVYQRLYVLRLALDKMGLRIKT